MLIMKDWFDEPSARANRNVLLERGYMPGIPFNDVIDMALRMAGLNRADVYITQIFHLLTPTRSHRIRTSEAKASFDTVTRYEMLGRRPIAAGADAARVLRHFGLEFIETVHPSVRGMKYRERAERISNAIVKT
ncbi:MAG: hypothetical protein QNJ44_20455 [Rhodobacter sp.]|nr:hypothetical protein [Rhodobacter sp.]